MGFWEAVAAVIVGIAIYNIIKLIMALVVLTFTLIGGWIIAIVQGKKNKKIKKNLKDKNYRL